jgi:hypothetical protein
MTFVAIRFATSTLALTGETVSTLPEMYHEISAALSVSGWTLMRTRIPLKSPNQSFDTRLCFHIDLPLFSMLSPVLPVPESVAQLLVVA